MAGFQFLQNNNKQFLQKNQNTFNRIIKQYNNT